MRDRRIYGTGAGRADPARRAGAPGIPGLRLGGHRGALAGKGPAGPQGQGPAEGALRADGRRKEPRRHDGRGAHALGHARRAQRRQLPPAPERGRAHRRRAQRHHRKLRRAQKLSRLHGRQLPLGDGHRGRRAAAGLLLQALRQHPRRGIPRARPHRGRLRPRHPLRRPAGELHRRAQGRAAAARLRRGLPFHRLGRDGDHQAHARRGLYGGRRGRRRQPR